MGTDSVPTQPLKHFLSYDLGADTSANGAATFTDGEGDAFFHGDRLDQLDGHLDIVARHDHLDAFGQLNGAGDVSGAHIELGR